MRDLGTPPRYRWRLHQPVVLGLIESQMVRDVLWTAIDLVHIRASRIASAPRQLKTADLRGRHTPRSYCRRSDRMTDSQGL